MPWQRKCHAQPWRGSVRAGVSETVPDGPARPGAPPFDGRTRAARRLGGFGRIGPAWRGGGRGSHV